MLNVLLTPPESDQAEVSLFGPGIGECIAIHYGNGRWFIIDSCLSPDSREPIALSYLESIGVDVASQVQGILITHWHEDHIKGLSRMFQRCTNASLYFSSALTSKESIELAVLFKKDLSNTDSGIREFREVISEVKARNEAHRVIPVAALSYLFHDPSVNTRMVALSPSSQAHLLALTEFRSLMPMVGDRRIRLFPRTENFSAVATHFSFGSFSALLGSDLEDSGNPNTGWSAVIASNIHTSHSLSSSQLYKVAHHGSETGHHNGIWSNLLNDRPLAIATPFISSKLPTANDILRISSLSDKFIVTRDVGAKGKVKRDPMVERELNAIVTSRRVLNDKMGHIQIRSKADGNFAVMANRHCRLLS